MKIEVFDDMIVIHSPDNSENNKFKGMLGFKEERYVRLFLNNLCYLSYTRENEKLDIKFNDEER